MAVQHVEMMPKESGARVEFQAEEPVAAAIVADFITLPVPDVQTYSVLKGNAAAGWVPMTLCVNWGEKFHMVWYFEAAEQPPP